MSAAAAGKAMSMSMAMAMAMALAACCVNSFLISAYHFISTFQRNCQAQKGAEEPSQGEGDGEGEVQAGPNGKRQVTAKRRKTKESANCI